MKNEERIEPSSTMNIIVVAVVLTVTFFMQNADASSDSTVSFDGGITEYDINIPEDRKAMKMDYADNPRLSACINRGEYALSFMKQRDEGVTQDEHLTSVRDQYEETKLDPQGAVPWHVYIDFERMVRDVHRREGSTAKSKYRYLDPAELWTREFKWCYYSYSR